MYFPKNFKLNDSVEIGELVAQAYSQYECFENETKWNLHGNYTLICELFYTWESINPFDKNSSIIDNFKKRNILNKQIVKMPIGFIAQRKNRLYVIFRGTKTVKEWISNLHTKLTKYFITDFGSVHDGFINTYLNIRDLMIDNIRLSPRTQVYIGGHSLGASFATFALTDIELNLHRKVNALYTYGSPRIGDNQFVELFNKNFQNITFRIVNTSDVVTSIPLPIILPGINGGFFSHVDNPVDFTIQTNDIEKNHNIHTYITELKKYCTSGILIWKKIKKMNNL